MNPSKSIESVSPDLICADVLDMLLPLSPNLHHCASRVCSSSHCPCALCIIWKWNSAYSTVHDDIVLLYHFTEGKICRRASRIMVPVFLDPRPYWSKLWSCTIASKGISNICPPRLAIVYFCILTFVIDCQAGIIVHLDGYQLLSNRKENTSCEHN